MTSFWAHCLGLPPDPSFCLVISLSPAPQDPRHPTVNLFLLGSVICLPFLLRIRVYASLLIFSLRVVGRSYFGLRLVVPDCCRIQYCERIPDPDPPH